MHFEQVEHELALALTVEVGALETTILASFLVLYLQRKKIEKIVIDFGLVVTRNSKCKKGQNLMLRARLYSLG